MNKAHFLRVLIVPWGIGVEESTGEDARHQQKADVSQEPER
jgi:hypothetical protein